MTYTPMYAIGQQLPNGATVVDDQVVTHDDGTVEEHVTARYPAGAEDYHTIVTYPPDHPQTKTNNAYASIQTLYDEKDSFTAQLQSDIQLVQSTGWDNLTSQQRTDVIVRMLQEGLGSSMQAHVDHMIASGIIAP